MPSHDGARALRDSKHILQKQNLTLQSEATRSIKKTLRAHLVALLVKSSPPDIGDGISEIHLQVLLDLHIAAQQA